MPARDIARHGALSPTKGPPAPRIRPSSCIKLARDCAVTLSTIATNSLGITAASAAIPARDTSRSAPFRAGSARRPANATPATARFAARHARCRLASAFRCPSTSALRRPRPSRRRRTIRHSAPHTRCRSPARASATNLRRHSEHRPRTHALAIPKHAPRPSGLLAVTRRLPHRARQPATPSSPLTHAHDEEHALRGAQALGQLS